MPPSGNWCLRSHVPFRRVFVITMSPRTSSTKCDVGGVTVCMLEAWIPSRICTTRRVTEKRLSSVLALRGPPLLSLLLESPWLSTKPMARRFWGPELQLRSVQDPKRRFRCLTFTAGSSSRRSCSTLGLGSRPRMVRLRQRILVVSSPQHRRFNYRVWAILFGGQRSFRWRCTLWHVPFGESSVTNISSRSKVFVPMASWRRWLFCRCTCCC